jgi:hypothetical protein
MVTGERIACWAFDKPPAAILRVSLSVPSPSFQGLELDTLIPGS